jgi:chromate transporter
LWALPLIAAYLMGATFLLAIGLFFSKLALVTFGGAYAVLAYMTQTVVTDYGWISTPEMIDAFGLAETTPGPLILVTQFVGQLAGVAQGGLVLGLLAGMMTLWVTFVPCFIWIFAGAPLIDWLDGYPRIRAGLAAITAAVVGVIANLSLWFAAHVVFDDVGVTDGPLAILSPVWSSFNLAAAVLTALAAALLPWRKWPMGLTLGTMALVGIAIAYLG